MSEHTPEIGSIWMDKDSGSDYAYKFKGIDNEEPFAGRLHFVRFDHVTGEEHEGGLYIGINRFRTDMVPADMLAKQPCCGNPTLYPMVWCDNCGYEEWDKARAALAKATGQKDGMAA